MRKSLTFPTLGSIMVLSFCLPCSAGDLIVGGQHCNSLCQSWLGIDPSAKSVAALMGDAHRPTLRPVAPAPIARRQEGAFFQSVAGATPSRPSARVTGLVLTKPALVSLDVVPARFERQNGLYDDGLTDDGSPQFAPLPMSRSHAPQIHLPHNESSTEKRVTIGLRDLPDLNQLVTTHGSVIVESSQDRAANAKLLAEMVKATSRPRQPVVDLSGNGPDSKNEAVPGIN